MSLTEHGLGVADGVRGVTIEHHAPVDAPDGADGAPAVHEDGFVPRNSGRPDLYPDIPHHFRSGPQQPAAGRLDEALAPAPAPATAPAPAKPPAAVQAAPPPGVRLPAPPPASPAPPVPAPAAAE